jgi:hypothetical protein
MVCLICQVTTIHHQLILNAGVLDHPVDGEMEFPFKSGKFTGRMIKEA